MYTTVFNPIVACLLILSMSLSFGLRVKQSSTSLRRAAVEFSRREFSYTGTFPQPFRYNVERRLYGISKRNLQHEASATPSIDQQAKLKKLKDLIATYQSNTSRPEGQTSSSTPVAKNVFADTLTFPTEFMIKIVGANEPGFAADMVKVVGSGLGPQPHGSEPLSHSTKETAGGKYISVSIKPLFRSADELYATYDRVRRDSRVKFML